MYGTIQYSTGHHQAGDTVPYCRVGYRRRIAHLYVVQYMQYLNKCPILYIGFVLGSSWGGGGGGGGDLQLNGCTCCPCWASYR